MTVTHQKSDTEWDEKRASAFGRKPAASSPPNPNSNWNKNLTEPEAEGEQDVIPNTPSSSPVLNWREYTPPQGVSRQNGSNDHDGFSQISTNTHPVPPQVANRDSSGDKISQPPSKSYPTPSRIVKRVGTPVVDNISPQIGERTTDPRRKAQQIEIEDGNLILHRSQNFFLRTIHRPGHRPKPLHKPTGHTTLIPRVMPDQDKRIAASETRIMPNVAPINPIKRRAFPVPPWLEALVVIVGLVASFMVHALNMFNFPRYELDEGTYMSSAWAILNGLITPYPYGYGHPPLAWMQIAAWVQLTGGFFTFGNAINSGRVLMLLYALGCSLLVYLIIRRFGGSRSAGLLAMIIFSLSPLSVAYQRQVLLDNVGTFWLLLSLYLLVVGNSRLLFIALAAVSFGVALLSKEIFVLFLPVMIYTVWLHTTKFQRKFALVAFTYIVIASGTAFVLMAILKGELFPYEWHLPGDTHPHLSMLDTFVSQAQRGQNEGKFLDAWSAWIEGDMLLMAFSIATTLFNLVVGWWNRKQLLLALFAISFWILLVRGGVVFPFYIIPMIPLAALNAAMAINTIMIWTGRLVRFDIVRALLIFGIIAVIVPYDFQHSANAFTQHPTSAQTDALVWIRDHVPHNSVIVINSYLYTDLKVLSGEGVGDGPTYPHAEVYWNLATDPTLYAGLLDNNYDRIDYIVADSEMLLTLKTNLDHMYLIQRALAHSVLRTEFRAKDHDQDIVIDIYQVIHQSQPTIYTGPPGEQFAARRDQLSAFI